MKSVIFTLILFISFQFQITAQEIIQWYGGIYRDLIQFNPPIAIPKEVPNLIRMKYQDGIITAKRDESAKGFLVNNGASAFDKQGNILFFFNGLRIYDKEGKVMEGGDSLGTKFSNFLLAEDWSFFDTLYGANFGTMYFSQIINYPGYNDQYLLFYTNKYYYSSKDIPFILCYAHIDMRQNNGMGKVISKEIEITRSPNLNPITIIRHGNGRDWWLINSQNSDNIFNFYLIDKYGVNHYIKHAVGPNIHSQRSVFYPHRISTDGSKIAVIYQCNTIGLFDIDRCTGSMEFLFSIEVSDVSCLREEYYLTEVCRELTNLCIYGIEFSSDSKFLYVAKGDGFYQIEIYQKSSNIIGNSVNGIYTALLQRFPNEKIYLHDGHELNRINLKGLSADLNYFGIDLPDTIISHIFIWPDYYLSKQVGSVCDTL